MKIFSKRYGVLRIFLIDLIYNNLKFIEIRIKGII